MKEKEEVKKVKGMVAAAVERLPIMLVDKLLPLLPSTAPSLSCFTPHANMVYFYGVMAFLFVLVTLLIHSGDTCWQW